MQLSIAKIVLAVTVGMTSSVAFAAPAVESPVRCCAKQNCTDCTPWIASCSTCMASVRVPPINSIFYFR